MGFGLTAGLVLLMGLVWGSFLGVVIYRTAKGGSPLSGRSECDKCKRTLVWWQNIPLVSFLILKGRCFFCKKPIDRSYPLIEIISAILFGWWYVMGRSFFLLAGKPWGLVQPFFWLVVGMVLLVIFITDLRYGIIADGVNLFLFSWVLIYRLALVGSGEMMMVDLIKAGAAGLVLTVLFWSLWRMTKGRGFGLGDVKLAPSMGLLLGWPRILVGVMASFVIGSVAGIALILTGKKRFGQTIPFAPFLVMGVLMALVWGNQWWSWYINLLQ